KFGISSIVIIKIFNANGGVYVILFIFIFKLKIPFGIDINLWNSGLIFGYSYSILSRFTISRNYINYNRITIIISCYTTNLLCVVYFNFNSHIIESCN